PTQTYAVPLRDALPISEARAMAPRLANGQAPPANTTTGYGKAGGSELSDASSVPIPRPRPQRGDTSRIQSGARMAQGEPTVLLGDRKSTRLNSSHVKIS